MTIFDIDRNFAAIMEDIMLVFDEETGEEIQVKYKTTRSEFSPRMLVKHLNLIDAKMMHEFCAQYSIPLATGDEIYNKLKGMNNPKLYRCIEKTLQEIRQTPQLLDCLT